LLTALLEYRDKSLRNENDVFAFTKLPTLAIVSYIAVLDHPHADSKHGTLFSRISKHSESTSG